MSSEEQIESLRQSIGLFEGYNLQYYFSVFLIALVIISMFEPEMLLKRDGYK